MISNGRGVTLAEMFYTAHQKNFNEDRLILSAAKCRHMIVVSGNRMYMRMAYSQGFLVDGASNTINVIP